MNRSVRWQRAVTVAILGVLAGLPLTAQALDPALALTQYSLQTWQPSDDEGSLPQNSVFSILQTHDGYLWLATQGGLARFDGQRFKVFNTHNTPQIHHDDVWTLLEARDGVLWIGTRGGGLTRYQNGRFTSFTKADGLGDDFVQALCEGSDGSLWIGTRGGGLTRYHEGAFSTLTTADGLVSNTVFALAEDRDGNLWIGTDNGGLSRYRDGKFTTVPGLSASTVYAIDQDRAGNLWVGTGEGLDRIAADGKVTVFGTADGLSSDNIRKLYEDRDGNLWIGTDGGGLNRYRDDRFSALTSKDGLSNDSVGAIYEDREGSLWVGTDAGGLDRLKDSTFVSYTTREGLSDDNARAILEDREGTLWVGTFGGLNRFAQGKFSALTTQNGLSSNIVLSLLQAQNGDLWAGTLNGGVNRFRDGKFTVFNSKNGLSNATVLSLCEDGDGAIWMGTRSGGLDRYADDRFTVFGKKDGLPAEDVRVIRRARDGGLWIGTLGGGLTRYRDGTFTTYSSKDGLSNDRVLEIYEDAEGVLWIGTFGGGLDRLKDGKFTAYNENNGLYDDAVFRILEDDSGNLWMSSNRGVFRVSRQSLNAVADGKASAVTSIAYGTADGMKSAETNGAHQPAGWKTRDGKLWFPTIRGIVSVDPQHLRSNPLPPPVLIEQFRVDNRPETGEAIKLPPGRHTLDFDYTALSYLVPRKVQFRYKLEGFDEDWVNAGAHRSAHYTNVPPGHYRFRVIASNNDGVWNMAGAELGFYQRPYFYQRRSFYLVYVLVILLSFAVGMRLRSRRMKALEARARELMTLVNERKQAADALSAANRALEQRVAELSRTNPADAVSGVPGPERVNAPAGDTDAMGKLVSDFNDTLGQLARLESELQQARDALAKEVEREAKTNRELEKTLQRLTETQARLIQSEKLASLAVLVSGMSHEINTPLGVGVTASSMLTTQTAQFRKQYSEAPLKRSDLDRFVDLTEKAGDIILRNLQRAAELVESFKKVAVDQTASEHRRFAVDAYIKEVVNSLATRIKATPHQVTVDCPPALIVDTYPGALAQILTSLVSNSLLHAFPDGKGGTIHIHVRQEGEQVVLQCADDGIGIPEENRGRVFDPFFTTARGDGRSGLGLNVVYNLVSQLLGGTIDLVDGTGKGTVFEIRFPLVTTRNRT